ncbi:MAG: UDP-N-acetylglucosamine 2-epimerase (non-hydrolyzing) [Kineosporiaceae bacterium]
MADDRVLVVMGTRPEAVKLLGLVNALGDRAVIAHTGQHYDEQLWGAVRREVGLPEAQVRIEVGGSHRGVQIGTATAALTEVLLATPVQAMIVQGDTNSTLAGALAANATGTLLVHVEAGLRSDDLSMPEESNRLLVDRIADLCCAPAEHNAERLLAEGVRPDRIVVTGNTLFDALEVLLPPPAQRSAVLERLGLASEGYVLATMHRVSNVDDPRRLRAMLEGFDALAHRVPVVLPLHPHTRARAEHAGLTHLFQRLRLLSPLTPTDFLALEAEAALIVSDSGGVQEEACFLRRPLLVLRDSTERPELLDGWCRLLGDADPAPALVQAFADAEDWRAQLRGRSLPYAEGGAGARIVAELDSRLCPRRHTTGG